MLLPIVGLSRPPRAIGMLEGVRQTLGVGGGYSTSTYPREIVQRHNQAQLLKVSQTLTAKIEGGSFEGSQARAARTLIDTMAAARRPLTNQEFGDLFIRSQVIISNGHGSPMERLKGLSFPEYSKQAFARASGQLEQVLTASPYFVPEIAYSLSAEATPLLPIRAFLSVAGTGTSRVGLFSSNDLTFDATKGASALEAMEHDFGHLHQTILGETSLIRGTAKTQEPGSRTTSLVDADSLSVPQFKQSMARANAWVRRVLSAPRSEVSDLTNETLFRLMREIPASNAHVAHQISHQPKHAALLTKVIDDALRSRAHSQARIDSKSDLIDPLRLEALLKHLQQQAPHVRRLLQTP